MKTNYNIRRHDKMMKIYLLTMLLFCQIALGQSAEEWLTKLKGSETTLEISLPKNEKITLKASERQNSFSKEGIRTFVLLHQGNRQGVLSVKGKVISGSVDWQGKEYRITSKNGKISLVDEKSHGGCGNCIGNTCSTHEGHSHSTMKMQAPQITALSNNNTAPIVPSDGVLRVYRLAVLIDYSSFIASPFNSNKDNVRQFLSELETYLNEMYTRDLGVKFVMINDDNLIRDTYEKRRFNNPPSGRVVNLSTFEINQCIGFENYDAGITITKISDSRSIAGLANQFDIYKSGKGAAFSIPSKKTIAHEIGHLFGSPHTFSNGGNMSLHTEPNRGQSIMSYGDMSPFFSLPSIRIIRNAMIRFNGYYSNENRTIKIPQNPNETTEQKNFPRGIETSNNAPVIDRNQIQAQYQLPPETSFQFIIPATDADGDRIIYSAHQADETRYDEPTKARMKTRMPSENHKVAFDPQYTFDERNYQNKLENYTTFSTFDKSIYTFWLGASDGGTPKENHATRYDVVETKVEIVEGRPFRITSGKGTNNVFIGGSKHTITWDVDEKIFGRNSRVRILMSDDFGKTWGHILAENTENDGSHEITIPNIDLTDQIQHHRYARSNKGLFRIEVIDHIATAITDGGALPMGGGFQIRRNPNATTMELKWVESSLPQKNIKVSCPANVPNAETNLPTTGGCKTPIISHEDMRNEQSCAGKYTITRTYKANDGCKEITYVQTIEVEDTEAPQFVAPLPQNTTAEEGNIPAQQTLTARDNCSGDVAVTKTEARENDKVIYTWTATDSHGNSAVYRQVITIVPRNIPPINFIGQLPQNTKVSCESIPAVATNLQAEGGCSALTITHKGDVISNQSCAKTYTITRTYEAKDTCGNTKTYTQTIEVEDKTKPVFAANKPENQTIEEGQPVPEQMDLTATDNCSANVTVAKGTPQETIVNGKLTQKIYTWTATDECGNTETHTQTITITPKRIVPIEWVENTLPKDVRVSCANEVPAPQNPQTTGGCTPVNITHNDVRKNGTCANKYVIERTYTATDNCNQSKSYTQTITVEDTIAPVWNIANLSQNTSVEDGQTIPTPPTLTATDNCAGTITATPVERRENGKVFYTWTANDGCGNEIIHTQTITITPRRIEPIKWIDNTLPKDATISCSVPLPAVKNPSATGGNGTLTISHQDVRVDGNCPNNYVIRRTYTATDGANSITHTQNISVIDTERPSFVGTLPSDLTIEEGQTIPIQRELTARDNCSANVNVVKSQDTSQANKIIYKWTADDGCGNKVEHTQTITITPRRIEPITFTGRLPQPNIRVSCNAVPTAEVLTATGGCSALEITHKDTIQNGNCANHYTITRVWTAKDTCGKTATYTQTIEVEDTTAPQFVEALPNDMEIEEGQSIPAPATLTATDLCGTANVVQTQEEITENGRRKAVIYKWVATDACGNAKEHTQTIHIKKGLSFSYNRPVLYPNPTDHNFSLNVKGIKAVKVYNMAGRLIKTFEAQEKYDISNLASSIYVLVVETTNEILTFKIIKK